MERLIPSDQLEEGRIIAHRRALSNAQTRPELSAAYAETADLLTDRITDNGSINPAIFMISQCGADITIHRDTSQEAVPLWDCQHIPFIPDAD